jgi:hypothetical protein
MLQFNVIFTPGTVRDFRLFTLSLLQSTRDTAFRLVANGCSPGEIALLRALCANYDRLSLLEFPSQRVAAHAEVIDDLFRRETAVNFCFMDSDILATGDFVEELTFLRSTYQGVFSGRNLWVMPDETVLTADIPRVGGYYSHTPSGLCLGGTYCAIYDRAVLETFLDGLQAAFPIWHKQVWHNIPAAYRHQLASVDLQRSWFDTAKVLNALLQCNGYTLKFVDSSHVHHIGGLSVFGMHRVHHQHYSLQERRTTIGLYLTAVFEALHEDQPLPPPPTLEFAEMAAHLCFIVEHLAALYAAHRDELRAAEQLTGYIHQYTINKDLFQNNWKNALIMWLHHRRIRWLPPGSARERVYWDIRQRLFG